LPAVTFDDFAGGLDVRQAAAISKPNILRVLRNAYITTGKAIRKRGCAMHIATLEAGTVGLKAFDGKLNTFYGDGAAITHADTRFAARRVPHVTTGAAPTKIHYADQYLAQLYVSAEYGDGTFRHHYLDPASTASPTWVTLAVHAANTFVVPTVPNGFRYEVTAGGGGASAAGEPVWPTTLGGTVVDGALTWTCRTFAVADSNCPHTKQVAKQASKMYAVGTDPTTVRFCKTGDARDWTTANDAGFLPAGLNARGSDEVTSINIFSDRSLAVFFSDNAQLWAVDPSPANMSLTSNIEGVGTLYHRAGGPVSRDLFFLAQTGYRSMSFTSLTNNLQDADVGSAIDKLVRDSVSASDDPIALYYPKLGQFWSINADRVWAYSFSRTSKISAWSDFRLPFDVDDACVLNQELYIRSGDEVFMISDSVYKDWTSDIPLVDIEMYFQDGKKPGVLKQWLGMDVIGTGTPTISFFYDASDPTLETQELEYPAITEPGEKYPVELMSKRIAPHIQHQKDEEFELNSLMLYFEDLGAIA
jgi:hypothetical protein